ncbi:MAG TPA: DinB family protein [Ohtaekwangia sp.]|nr:DinB family protein [Ohtaekwangia sp.]
MNNSKQPEAWQRGPVPGVPGLLQPVAHALIQATEEVHFATEELDAESLWEKPAGVASVGFHLQHIRGVLDRLFTYARGEVLNKEQLQLLATEEQPRQEGVLSCELVALFKGQVDLALEQLRHTDESTLLQPRGIGRKQIPTTVIGLLVHAAEHTQRHVGQLIVTARVIAKKDY